MIPALILTAALMAAAPAAAQTAVDETAVRRLVADYLDARDRRDQAAVGDLFTEDADQHTTAGTWRRGRAQIMSGTLDSSMRNPGDRGIKVETVRFVGPDVAVVDGPYEIVSPDGRTRRMWATLVAARDGGRWRIAAIRNALPTGG